MKTNQQNEIVDLFEKYQMNEQQIADELRIDPAAVKAALLQFSPVYRKVIAKIASKPDKTEEEYEKFRTAYEGLAEYTDDMHLKEKIYRNLMDEVKGRKDAALKKLEQDERMIKGNITVNNITVFNSLLQKAREEKARLEEKVVVSLPEPVKEALEEVCI